MCFGAERLREYCQKLSNIYKKLFLFQQNTWQVKTFQNVKCKDSS